MIVQEIWRVEANSVVYLDVTMASDNEWVDCLLYKLTVLNFPSKLVKIVSSFFNSRTFEASFQIATSTWQHRGWNNFTRPLQTVY